MSHTSRALPAHKPLIQSAKNKWQHNEKWTPYNSDDLSNLDASDSEDEYPNSPLRIRSIPSRSKRYILLGFLLFLICTITFHKLYTFRSVEMTEDAKIAASFEKGPIGSTTAHQAPEFAEVVLLQDLASKYVPSTGKSRGREGRLVIVGDVHGMKDSLVKLLEKVEFNKKHDHLILAGDMISKGPDSRGVLDLAMELGASAVRGNHEDRVLTAYSKLHHGKSVPAGVEDEEVEILDEEEVEIEGKTGEKKDKVLAKRLKHKHVKWLKKCPVILRVGDIEGMGQVIVVHAGLVPGVDLKSQDPYFVMNMRTMDLDTHIPSDGRDGIPWTKFWNHYQESLPKHKRSTVIYGHDSKRGLNIQRYSKGIDTGCLKGGELTALVIEGGHSEAKQSLVHVKCKDGRP